MNTNIQKPSDSENKVIYPELSYNLVGAAFNIFNTAGYGMSEYFYQKAFAAELEQNKINFEKEKFVRVDYGNQNIGKFFLDCVVDNKIVVELKVRPKIGYVHIKQVTNYLKSTGYKLAILIYFTRDGVKYRRIINAL